MFLTTTQRRNFHGHYTNKHVHIKDNREKYISFCKFYNEPIDVKNVEELFKLKIGDQTLEQIFKSLPDSSFDIY